MKTLPIDRNLFRQIGLDSGSLTMLGAIAHSFGEPGEYRGTVRRSQQSLGVFYLTVDPDSPIAQADIDLADLAGATGRDEDCEHERDTFTVHPRGYALFRVSAGPGGYDVLVRRASESEDTPVFDSRALPEGVVFAARLLRPGRYRATNTLGQGELEVVVPYPERSNTAYRPPTPARVRVTAGRLVPERVELSTAQGLLFDCEALSRIVIELEEPDDGPGEATGA